MAYIQYLVFNGRSLPKPDSYDVGLSDVEADSGGETEAGTNTEGCGKDGSGRHFRLFFSITEVGKTSDGIFQTAEDRSGIFRYGNLGLKRSRNVYYWI